MPVVGLLEKSPIDLAQVELVLRRLHMDLVLLRRVSCRSNLVEAPAGVRRRCQLARRYTRRHGVWNHSMVFVLLGLVLQESLVDGLQVVPLRRLVVVTRVGIVQVGGSLNEAGARSSRAKSWDL